MKSVPFLILTSALLAVAVHGSDPQERPAQPYLDGTKVPSPMAHPWDAESWEAGSSSAFWRKTFPRAVRNTAIAPLNEEIQKPAFSSRQSEK